MTATLGCIDGLNLTESMSQSILKSVGLNESTPIYTDDENNSVGNALCNIISSGEMCFELLMQKFWNFIYCLTDGEQINTVSNAEEYIQKAETFIKTNVHKKYPFRTLKIYRN